MDARPSPEQRQLEDAADRLARKLGPGSVGDLDDDGRRERLDDALRQAGWRELRSGTVTEPVASGVECAIVVRALARRACDTPFFGPLLAGDLLRRTGSDLDPQTRTIVVSPDLQRLAEAPSAEGAVAVDAARCTTALVLTPNGGAHGLADVVLGPPAVGVDLTRSMATVAGGTVTVPVAATGELVPDELTAWTALAVTLTAADLVGAMEGALELATDYAKQRHQYGAAIGTYQAVQHLLAEAATLIEGAVSAVTHAAWAVDALPAHDARSAAAVAKAYAARAGRTVCETAIQIHGGIGNTWECMAHVFLRRALLATELFGSDGPQLALLARERWGSMHGVR